METKTFSPKEVAEILGVSESSVKRWVDAGHVPVHRTQGGHRRILLPDLVRFIREGEMRVLRPDLLGIDFRIADRSSRLDVERLYQLLLEGNGAAVRGGLVSAYLDGTPIVEILDRLISPAFERLGTLWQQGDEGIFLEHRAMTLGLEALHQIRLVMPERNGTTPVIVGGAPSGDPYILPGLCVSLALKDAGFLTVNLGPDTPASAFLHAVSEHRARLVWLSMTSLQEGPLLQRHVNELADALRPTGVPLVVGGQAARELSISQPEGVTVLENTSELVAHVRELFDAES